MITKDIEKVKEIIEHKDDYDVAYGYRFEKPCQIDSEKIKSIENVLKELETYKKIAEKLADELRFTVNINKVCGTLDIEKKRCHKEDISCKQCAIDWARKEVEKDE